MENIEIEFEELEEELEIDLVEENGLPLGYYESKNALKNVANEYGGEITDETPFADYAPEFDRIIEERAESVTAELEKTQAELTETQGKLTETESELSETKSTLETTRGELAETEEELAEAIAAQIKTSPLTVTENGTYTANEKEAFNPVTVDVQADKSESIKELISCRASNMRYLFENFGEGMDRTEATERLRGLMSYDMLSTKNSAGIMGMFRQAKVTEIMSFDTKPVINMQQTFYGCSILVKLGKYDLRNATNNGNTFEMCSKLEEVWIDNLRSNISIGSGKQWGHLIKKECLIYIIKGLRDVGEARTLTIGSVNLEKIANVYVRPIEITDEMRKNDDLIDEKLPFEECESTDEGACSIIEYVSYKNWEIQ